MGVPAFYRWLAEKYPKTVVDCIEAEAPPRDDGTSDFSAVDIREPNPNGVEVDNLYLDMNGVIHPCSHPENGPQPTSEDEIFANIERYIDRLVAAVRPRRLLFMAVDGPAPRAKMNQQRSRRFKAAKDGAEREAEEARLRAEWHARGLTPPPKRDAGAFHFDSNVITPGTSFMARLADALRAYVARRLASQPGWRGLAVILSDASVPGEGEHKIMQHIRVQRSLPGYDANMWHVVHGLDADLIMLALATHEPRFMILREMVFSPRDRKKRAGLGAAAAAEDEEDEREAQAALALRRGGKPLQLLRINTLREYLRVEFGEMSFEGTPEAFDLERVIDDFVFLCFFVGNDFLPHMPALEIHDGAIDTLMGMYATSMAELGGYVTTSGEMDLRRAELLLRKVGAYEEDVFARRRKRDAGKRRSIDERARLVQQEQASAHAVANGGASPYGALYPPRGAEALKLWKQLEAFADARKYDERLELEPQGAQLRACAHLYCHMLGLRADAGHNNVTLVVTLSLPHPTEEDSAHARGRKGAAQPKAACAASGGGGAELAADAAPPAAADAAAAGAAGARARTADERRADEDAKQAAAEEAARASRFAVELKLALDRRDTVLQSVPDTISYGAPGWRDRYYSQKLGIGADEPGRLREVVTAYVEGLCWVLRYYYQGVQSWGWFYPYHYAPCASDMKHLAELSARVRAFELGTPWSPLMQLMAVFPARSGHALPPAYRALMSSHGSPVIDFYPQDFAQDLNGKKFGWQAIALLPFIEHVRLASALEPLKHTLSEVERTRDSHGSTLVFTHAESALGLELRPLAGGAGADSGVVAGARSFAPAQRVGGVPYGGTARRPAELLHAGAVLRATADQPRPEPHKSIILPTVLMPAHTLADGDGPLLSKDAKMISRERERSAAGGGRGGGYGGGYGGANRRAGIGHAERGAGRDAAQQGGQFAPDAPAGRMVRAVIGRGRGEQPKRPPSGGGASLANAFSLLSAD